MAMLEHTTKALCTCGWPALIDADESVVLGCAVDAVAAYIRLANDLFDATVSIALPTCRSRYHSTIHCIFSLCTVSATVRNQASTSEHVHTGTSDAFASPFSTNSQVFFICMSD